MVESKSMVNGPSPGPAPAAQARDSNSRLTRSQLADVAPPEAAQESSQGSLSQKWKLRIGGADRGQRIR